VKKLKENDIDKYFDSIVISSDIGYIKPHQEIFHLALRKDGLKPGEALFIGDSYNQDIAGAKNAGMKTVWFNCRNEIIDNPASADYRIMRIDEIFSIIESESEKDD